MYQQHIPSWWRHQMESFSALLPLCAGNSPVPVNSPHKGQWRRALMSSLICAWINDRVNNREAGDLRRHLGHYDVNVMMSNSLIMLESRCHLSTVWIEFYLSFSLAKKTSLSYGMSWVKLPDHLFCRSLISRKSRNADCKLIIYDL